MPMRHVMARLLAGRAERELAEMHAVDHAAHAAVRYGLERRQENAARLACRPSPSPIETSIREAPAGVESPDAVTQEEQAS